MKAKLNHITELDGTRGIAVLLVMIFHFVHLPLVSNSKADWLFIQAFHAGWIGVDLFFVLSGFLITRILIHDKAVQKFSRYLRTFYEKRSLRIFPLYYAYLIFIFFIFFPLAVGHLDQSEQAKLISAKHDQLWFWLYVSNIKQVLNGRFFGASVGHLWSLSIEEQFYLFWPFIIYFASIKNIKRISIFILFFAPVLRLILWLAGMVPSSIYVFTFARMDALAMGALVAVLSIQNVTFKFNKLIIFILLSLSLSLVIIYSFGIRYDSHPMIFVLGYSLLALTFGGLIFLFQSPYSFWGRSVFKSKFLVFMGKYSYAIYLFHPMVRNAMLHLLGQPKIFFGNQMIWDISFIVVCSSISVGLALLSWNFFEKWFLKLKNKIKIPEKASQLINT